MVSPPLFLSTSWLAVGLVAVSTAFQPLPLLKASGRRGSATQLASTSAGDVEAFLSANYPSASAFLSKNGDAMKAIIKSEVGFTIFAPNEAAFRDLGDKKRAQLEDVRNGEVTELHYSCCLYSHWRSRDGIYLWICFHSAICRHSCQVTDKIASYHVILEPVTADQLFNSGGVVTEGGEVPLERSVSGGFFGVGGKEVSMPGRRGLHLGRRWIVE